MKVDTMERDFNDIGTLNIFFQMTIKNSYQKTTNSFSFKSKIRQWRQYHIQEWYQRLISLLANLNDLEMIAPDIGNVYSHEETRRKQFKKIEFRGNHLKGNYLVIHKSLYR